MPVGDRLLRAREVLGPRVDVPSSIFSHLPSPFSDLPPPSLPFAGARPARGRALIHLRRRGRLPRGRVLRRGVARDARQLGHEDLDRPRLLPALRAQGPAAPPPPTAPCPHAPAYRPVPSHAPSHPHLQVQQLGGAQPFGAPRPHSPPSPDVLSRAALLASHLIEHFAALTSADAAAAANDDAAAAATGGGGGGESAAQLVSAFCSSLSRVRLLPSHVPNVPPMHACVSVHPRASSRAWHVRHRCASSRRTCRRRPPAPTTARPPSAASPSSRSTRCPRPPNLPTPHLPWPSLAFRGLP